MWSGLVAQQRSSLPRLINKLSKFSSIFASLQVPLSFCAHVRQGCLHPPRKLRQARPLLWVDCQCRDDERRERRNSSAGGRYSTAGNTRMGDEEVALLRRLVHAVYEGGGHGAGGIGVPA
jgi:hypothetical protein